MRKHDLLESWVAMYRDLSNKLSRLETRRRNILEQKRAMPASDKRQAKLQAEIESIRRQIAEAKAEVSKRDTAKLRQKASQARAKISRRKPRS